MSKGEMKKFRLGDIILDCASGPFGSNIKAECFIRDGFPFIDGANLKGITLTDNITKFVTEEKARSLSRSIAKRGDIVITHRGTLGQFVYIPYNSKYEEYLCSQSLFRATLNTDIVNPIWITYYFHSNVGQKKLLSFANYVGVPALAQPLMNFKKLEISLPPLPIQRKIAAVLTALDDKIALNKRINDKLEAMAKRLYDYWFVQFDFPDENGRPYKSSGGKMVWNETLKREIPAGWEVKPLKQFAFYRTDTTKSENAYNYISTDNMLPDKQGISDETIYPSSGNIFQYKQNDILISNIRPYFKKIWLASYNGTCSTDILCISSNQYEHNCYIYRTLWRDDFFDYVMQGAKGSKMPRGDKEHIMNYPICFHNYLTNVLLKSFNDKCIVIQEMLYRNNKETMRLTALRDRLLPLLMNGQVVIKDLEEI